MSAEDYEKWFGDKLKDDVLFAVRFLEMRGMKFMRDFGWENAVDLASQIMTYEIWRLE